MGRVEVGGLGFDALREAELNEIIIDRLNTGVGGRVVFVNLDVARRAGLHREMREAATSADLILADGMPLVWASRLLRSPLPERVAGSSVILSLTAAVAAAGLAVVLVGGRPGCAPTAAELLRHHAPGSPVTWHTPPFGFEQNPAELEAIEAAIAAAGPGVCFVGLGFPKQEKLMARLAKKFPDRWFVACGASIDFLAEGSRAPAWMQRAGLEWAHRLGHEPRRLARRYLLEGVPFGLQLLAFSAMKGIRSGNSIIGSSERWS